MNTAYETGLWRSKLLSMKVSLWLFNFMKIGYQGILLLFTIELPCSQVHWDLQCETVVCFHQPMLYSTFLCFTFHNDKFCD